jgi:hypothetical protein
MSTSNQYEALAPDPSQASPVTGGGYMLSVKVSSHPAFYAGEERDDAGTGTAYNCTVNTTPSADDGTVITFTYFHNGTDITSTVDTYLQVLASYSPCTTPTPSSMPLTLPTSSGSTCFSFQKQSAYSSDHTFQIQVSGAEATNSPKTPVF